MRVLLIVCSFVVVASVGAAVVRIARGPTTFDRLLAGSYALASSVALLLFIGFLFERPDMFADIGLAYALVAFLFPLSVARFLEARTSESDSPESESPEPRRTET